jgi:hypothetical protein
MMRWQPLNLIVNQIYLQDDRVNRSLVPVKVRKKAALPKGMLWVMGDKGPFSGWFPLQRPGALKAGPAISQPAPAAHQM